MVWAGLGGKVLVVQWLAHMSFTCFSSAVIRLKHSTLVACEKSVSSFTLPNATGFLQILRIPPVQTLD